MEIRKGFFQGVFDKIKAVFDKKSDTFNNLSLVESYNANNYEIENIEIFYKLISKISAIPKSIQEISQNIISQSYKIVDSITEKELKTIPFELEEIIKNPFIDYAYEEFISLVVTDLLVAGNIFCYLIKEKNKTYLRRVDPRYVQRMEESWIEANPYGSVIELKPEFLIHVKYLPDPYNPIWGKGVIANNSTLFNNIKSMLEFRENFYENGCFPGGVFSVENAGAMDERTIKAKIKDRNQGSKNAGEPIVLTGKVTYHQTQLDPTTLKISEEMILLQKEAMAAFGMPRFLMELGLRDSGQKYNNHALQYEYFLKSTIIPIANKVALIFTNLAQRYSERLKFIFDIRQEVFSEADLQALLDCGTINRAEHREMLNIAKSKDKNLEVHLVPSNTISLEDAIEGAGKPELPPALPSGLPGEPKEPKNPKEPEPPKQPQLKPPKKIENGQPRNHSWRDEHYLSEPEDEIWNCEEIKKERNRKRIRQDFINLNTKTRSKKTKEQQVKLGLYLIDLYGTVLANTAKNGAEINRLSGAKEEKKDAKKIIESIYDPNEDLLRLEKITLPLYQSVGDATYANTSNVLTVATPFFIGDPGVAEKINLLRQNGPLVQQTTKGKITEILQQGIAEGKTHNEIAKDIWKTFVDENNDLVDEFSKIYREGVAPKDFDAVMSKGGKLQSRATLIARTEVARANRLFAAESMKKSGVVKTVMIINCEPGCPICGPHQNVEVDFSQAIDLSNLHPNCSGTIVPGTISSD